MSVLTSISEYVDTFLDTVSTLTHDVPIVIFDFTPLPPEYIWFNTEQLTREDQLHAALRKAKLPGCVDVWEYSLVNVQILAKHGISAKHMPLKTSAEYRCKLLSYIQPVYDVGFCGNLSVRRHAILNELSKTCTVCVITAWGDVRDRALAKCRIVLNIHFAEDYKVFESARCEPWLAIGVPVVSESSLDDDPRATNVPYSELVSTCLHLLK